ncbi:leucine-rich repeat and immunoglobulin-like domain-containing nogo receptor-interacting protein 3 [Thrips palmi]|uniref:Leucine-rich repeat and immunoglobulin-like domain-containing nogo receptor-interacting protein 3 n=1 Tax=Thrips palmi TaxID=161013 RepID=A0A6P9A4P4_THRPL|nr:leucine-rich repeat and immunoglobulin-like domain-containing nogo receptor-interacting protein 3 [Thrips palmi]
MSPLLVLLLLAVVAPWGAGTAPSTADTSTVTTSTTTASTTTAPTPTTGGSNGGCPAMCRCGPEPLPVPEAADVEVSGPRASMACAGVPVLSEDHADVELLRVGNTTMRRLDFWALRRLPGLRVLHVQGSGVAELTGSGKANRDLRVLDLTANSLHVLGGFAFRDLAELRVLNLTANGLHSIAPSALALPKLTVLDLRRNRLAVLKPHFFADAPALRELYLADNALSRVPALVLPALLHVLDLSGNHIIRVEDSAFDAVNVTNTLDLSRNALRRVPHVALRRLGAVRDLVLSDNPLGDAWGALPAGAVVGLAVRTLHLQRLRSPSPALALATVRRGALQALPELRELRLSANPDLTYVHPQGLAGVPRLHTLDLSSTPLLALERELLDAAPSLKTLRLDNGTLHCHCSLGWLRNLTQGPVSCRGPPSPQPPCAPYIIPLFPEAFSETLGNNASFHCRALFGAPAAGEAPAKAAAKASVSWRTHAGVELSEGECADAAGRVCVRDHVLTVLYLHAEDAGTYTCEARAPAGQDARAVRLHVRDVHVRLLPLTVTSTFVTLAWNMSSAVTNSYTLRVEEVPEATTAAPGASAAPPPAPRSVTFTVGLKMHSYTVHGLKPHSRYAFTLAIQREAYSLVIGSTEVTTREGAFLVSLGIERNYLSIILVSVVGGAATAACLGLCGLRCWRQRLRLKEAAHLAALRKSDSAFSGREMLSQPGTPTALDTALDTDSPPLHTLFRGITYISLADERSAPSECGRSIEQDLISFT